MIRTAALSIALVVGACSSNPGGPGGGGDDDDGPVDPMPDAGDDPLPPAVAPEIGTGDHTPGSVDLVVVAQGPSLNKPMDFAFDPATGNLWIVNQLDDSWTILRAIGSSFAAPERFYDDSGHFLRKPSTIAFGEPADRALATCQESNNGGDGFMGPVAWTSDLVRFEGGTNSHYDMLHESNLCMGIAWHRARSYWVFNGTLGLIDRVDFHGWHPDAAGGLGGHDHTDGEYFRYLDAKVKRTAGVSSGMEVDPADGMLYVADTGNARIARMPTDGAIGPRIGSTFDEVPMYRATGALEDVVPSGQLQRPSGLTIKNGVIYTSDHATGTLYAFDKAGKKINWLDTGLGANHVGSLAIGPDGKLYFLDTPGNKLYRVDPK